MRVPSMGGLVEFQKNNPPGPVGHANIDYPPSGFGGIIPHSLDTGLPDFITSFEIPVEGDYLITIHITTSDSGGNLFSLVEGGALDTPGTTGAFITTGTLTGYTPVDPTPQGTEIKESVSVSIMHFTAGQILSIVNTAVSGQASLGASDGAVIAGIVFELLRAGPPA